MRWWKTEKAKTAKDSVNALPRQSCLPRDPGAGPQNCGKRIGNAVFAGYPGPAPNTIVHYQCMVDPKVDPRTVRPPVSSPRSPSYTPVTFLTASAPLW